MCEVGSLMCCSKLEAHCSLVTLVLSHITFYYKTFYLVIYETEILNKNQRKKMIFNYFYTVITGTDKHWR